MIEENKWITKEELINHPEIWTETEGLNLDFFDFCLKDISNSYFLKKKGEDVVYFGHYEPDSQSFVCHQLHAHTETTIKKEDISCFISLPEMNFQSVKEDDKCDPGKCKWDGVLLVKSPSQGKCKICKNLLYVAIREENPTKSG